jgi:hypothetical protein
MQNSPSSSLQQFRELKSENAKLFAELLEMHKSYQVRLSFKIIVSKPTKLLMFSLRVQVLQES